MFRAVGIEAVTYRFASYSRVPNLARYMPPSGGFPFFLISSAAALTEATIVGIRCYLAG